MNMQSVEVQLSCQRYHTTNLSEGFEICSEYKASQVIKTGIVYFPMENGVKTMHSR